MAQLPGAVLHLWGSAAPLEQFWPLCISAFLPQLPGARPSCREHLGGGGGDRGGSNEKAAGQDLGEAASAGGAVPCLEAEGGPGVLCDDLCLPHQHLALAQKMTARAQPPLLTWQGG